MVRAVVQAAKPYDAEHPHFVDGVGPALLDHPVQQTVLGLIVHAGDLQGCRLRDVALLPVPQDSRDFDAVFDGAEFCQLGRGDPKSPRHAITDAARKILSGFPAFDVGPGQPLCLLGQEGVALTALAVGLDDSRDLLISRHRRQDPAQDIRREPIPQPVPQAAQGCQPVMAGNQPVTAAVGQDRQWLQQAVGLDGVHQFNHVSGVNGRIKVQGIHVDQVQRNLPDLGHGVRIGYRRHRRGELGDIKPHGHTPSTSSATQRR